MIPSLLVFHLCLFFVWISRTVMYQYADTSWTQLASKINLFARIIDIFKFLQEAKCAKNRTRKIGKSSENRESENGKQEKRKLEIVHWKFVSLFSFWLDSCKSRWTFNVFKTRQMFVVLLVDYCLWIPWEFQSY